jgi:hypothetical protein
MTNDAIEVLRDLARNARASEQRNTNDLQKLYFLGKAEAYETAIAVIANPADFG